MFLARLIPRMCHNINRYDASVMHAQHALALLSVTHSPLLPPPPPHPLYSSPSSRVVYVFGSPVKEPPTDITPTFLTTGVLSTLRQADFVAHSILRESGECVCLCACVTRLRNQRGVIVCIFPARRQIPLFPFKFSGVGAV